MISKETCEQIWHCYREIEVGHKLLADILEAKAKWDDHRREFAPELKDAFGRKQGYQLGIPMESGSTRLIDVAPALTESIVRAHIGRKESELLVAQEKARIELDGKEAAQNSNQTPESPEL